MQSSLITRLIVSKNAEQIRIPLLSILLIQEFVVQKKLLGTICTAHDWITQGKMKNRFHADLWTASLCAQTAIIYSILASFCNEKKRLLTVRGLRKMAFVLYGANGLTLDTTGMHSTAWAIIGGL